MRFVRQGVFRQIAGLCAVGPLILATLGWLAASLSVAMAEKRVALVIGNSSYVGLPRLANPESDARAMAKMLAGVGFDVGEVRLDLGVGELQRALSELNRKAADADIAVVYFAGHGIEVDRTNWLIPVDAKLQSSFDVEAEAASLDRLIRAVAPARSLRLVILDACRNDPFRRTWRTASRDVGARGLAQIEEPPANTLVAYAARAGTLAKDGAARENSPYAKALLKYLPEPGLDIRLALGRVRDEVLEMTGQQQEPFLYGSLGGRQVVLKPGVIEDQSRKEGLLNQSRFLTGAAQAKLREGKFELATLLAREALQGPRKARSPAVVTGARRDNGRTGRRSVAGGVGPRWQREVIRFQSGRRAGGDGI